MQQIQFTALTKDVFGLPISRPTSKLKAVENNYNITFKKINQRRTINNNNMNF